MLEVSQILNQYTTPMYIFDIDILRNRIAYLRRLSPISLCFAMKANPFIVKDIEDIIDKLEVCSPGEYAICKANDIASDKLVISGVYKTPEVIEEMIKDGVKTYTIESMNQFELLKQLSYKYSFPVNLLLRLTSGNQFGMNREELFHIIKQYKDDSLLNIIGIQFFSGTQKTSLKRISKECMMLDEFIEELDQVYHYTVEELEYGPGFPVNYFQDSKPMDEEQYLNQFYDLMMNMKYSNHITIELGRSIAASCGYYLTRVVDKKVNQNGNYAILDGGMHHLTYYGQMMAMKHPFYDIYPSRKGNSEKWNLCGSLCTINDLIVKQLEVNDLSIGDVFIFKNTGAYCMSEGISLFLSRDLPRVLLKYHDEIVQVREDIDTYHLNLGRRENQWKI